MHEYHEHWSGGVDLQVWAILMSKEPSNRTLSQVVNNFEHPQIL